MGRIQFFIQSKGPPKVPSEVYTQAAVAVREAALAVWEAVLQAGAPHPPGFTGGPKDWIAQDRNRALVRAYAAGFSSPEVKACERAYQAAFNACVKRNFGLVQKVAHKLLRKGQIKGLELEDLSQEGVLGMQRALETFDPEKKVSFSTYAFFWIYQTINRSIDNAGTIRIPIRTQELASKGKKDGKLGDRAREASRLASLDAPIGSEPDAEHTLMDVVSSPNPSPEEVLSKVQDINSLTKILSHLTDREMCVVQGRYVEDKTLEEVGRDLGLTRERVRQIEAGILQKIRQSVTFGRVGFNGGP